MKRIALFVVILAASFAQGQRGEPLTLTQVKNNEFYFRMGNVYIRAACRHATTRRDDGTSDEVICGGILLTPGDSAPFWKPGVGGLGYLVDSSQVQLFSTCGDDCGKAHAGKVMRWETYHVCDMHVVGQYAEPVPSEGCK